MRVVCISHDCIVPLNRRPYDLLATRHGVDLTLIVPERWRRDLPDPDLRYAGVPGGAATVSLPVQFSGNGTFFVLRSLSRTLRELRPDVILLHQEPWSLVAMQVVRAARGAALVFYTEQNIAKSLPPPFSWIRRATYRTAVSAWAVGTTSEETLRATGFERPIAVVPHGVEVSAFRPGHDAERRRALGLDGVIVGYAGRLVAEKGIEDLLMAAKRLADEQPPLRFTLLIAGAGPLLGACERARADLGPRLVTLPAVPHHEAPSLFRLMDTYVLPSRTTRSWREQFGRVLVEAAACGLPVVGTSSGEIPHVLAALGGTRTVPERDPAALANALRAYIADDAVRSRDGAANLTAARARFSQEAVADRMWDLLSAVPARPRATAVT